MHAPPPALSAPLQPEEPKQTALLRVRVRRRLTYAVVGLAGFVVLSLAADYAFHMARAVAVFAFVDQKPRPLRIYDRFFGYQAVFTDSSIAGSAGPIEVRIYKPAGKSHCTPIVMVHGLVPYGNRDGYLDSVANNLAEMGYMIVLPNLPAETHFEMRTADLRVIADTIRWTSETTGEKVSVLGASFGGGLAVAAALQPSVAQDVKLIFSLSGYYNLDSIARFYIHDQVYDPNGHPYSGEPPGPLLILAQYLDELVPPNELKRLEAEMIVLKRNQGFQFTDRDPSVADLTQTERHDLNQLQTVDTPEIHQRYMDILERHREDIAAMSPSGVVKGLKVPLYVLHGQDDRVLPEGDIEWMRKVLQGNPNAHILVTPWIGHAVIGQPATVRQKLDVARFGAEILRGISRSVSLH